MKVFQNLMLLTFSALLCATAQAQQGVCIFKDSNYEGPRRCFENNIRDFDRLGINDQASSFQVHGDVDIVFYEHVDYKGANKRFQSDQSFLTDGMNDNFSSMKIVKSRKNKQWGDRGRWGRYSGSGTDNNWDNDNDRYENDNNVDNRKTNRVCLYADQNYRGKGHCFKKDNPRFENFGFDNKADSLRIDGDLEVELFQHADYKGFSRIYRDSIPRFSSKEHDQYSAIRIRKRGRGEEDRARTGQACLYPDRNYGGEPFCFTSNNPRFANFGFDNKADSLRIRGDIEVILYQHENYTGYSRVFRDNIPNFRGKDHDQYSSIKIRKR